MPGYYRANAARNAERRYLRNREPETKRVEKRREATAQVLSMCCLIALNRAFGLGEGRLQKVQDRAVETSKNFEQAKKVLGWNKAKQMLNTEVREVFDGDFVLPVILAPKKPKDWDALHEMRDAADPLVKFYIQALHEVMGFGRDRIGAFVEKAKAVYREFGERAKDGDWYGYMMLAQEMSRILRSEMVVDESEADQPIFGVTLD
jgi:hypothetical protein